MSLPSKEQLDKIAKDTIEKMEIIKQQSHKSDCEYMWSLMVETLNKAVTSNNLLSHPFIHTDINQRKLSDTSASRIKLCNVGPTNEPIEKLLEPLGVKLYIPGYQITSFISYDKSTKTLRI